MSTFDLTDSQNDEEVVDLCESQDPTDFEHEDILVVDAPETEGRGRHDSAKQAVAHSPPRIQFFDLSCGDSPLLLVPLKVAKGFGKEDCPADVSSSSSASSSSSTSTSSSSAPETSFETLLPVCEHREELKRAPSLAVLRFNDQVDDGLGAVDGASDVSCDDFGHGSDDDDDECTQDFDIQLDKRASHDQEIPREAAAVAAKERRGERRRREQEASDAAEAARLQVFPPFQCTSFKTGRG